MYCCCYGSVSVETVVSVFTVSVYFIPEMSVALRITFVEIDQTNYFASNHTLDGQHCYVRL